MSWHGLSVIWVWDEERSSRHQNLSVNNLMQHTETSSPPAFLKGGPPEQADHLCRSCGSVWSATVLAKESTGCPLLDHFQCVFVFLGARGDPIPSYNTQGGV